jgi:hypothetical protein
MSTGENVMNQIMDPVFTSALRRELTQLPLAKKKYTFRRLVVASSVLALLSLSTVAVAGLRFADEIAATPLSAPLIVNGVGPAFVPLSDAPENARYLRFEIACLNGSKCASPAGSVMGPDDGNVKVERGSLPLTNYLDPNNAQNLEVFDPRSGLHIDVEKGTHWRLYAVYTSDLNSRVGVLDDGRTLGIPGNEQIPNLIPAETILGKNGWIEYEALMYPREPLTGEGVAGGSILIVYAGDGLTVLGRIEINDDWMKQPYRGGTGFGGNSPG